MVQLSGHQHAEPSTPFLEVRDLHKRFGGVHALQGVSLKIERGQIYHLLGENGCGKSTLIKVISGAHLPTEGQLIVNGKEQKDFSPIKALEARIETVYQDLSLLPNLTVAENIGLCQQLVSSNGALFRRLDGGQLQDTAIRALQVVGLPIDRRFRNTEVSRLPIATRQLVAIARAVASKAGLVIMDEPTTALTHFEVKNLIAVVRRLQEDGVSVLFVTHKLDECKAIGGHGLVMRDGKLVCNCDITDITTARLGYLMTGRELNEGRYREAQKAGDPLLRLSGLGKSGAFVDIDLALARGEILGVTGLLDSGRNELAKALAGVEVADTGEVFLDGALVDLSSPGDANKAGIGYVPEDRLTEGLFLEKPILDNTVMGILARLRNKIGLLDKKRAVAETEEMIDDLQIVAPDVSAPVQSLSGGNQQRVLIGRWLKTTPKLLILHGPTVGVDVGSKDTIYRIIQRQAEAGMGILIISDDLPELLQNCDRVAVMRKGKIASIFPVEGLTQDKLYAEMGAGLDLKKDMASQGAS
ncbi:MULTISPECIES: sugar ABC transporter ATP-binding protein [Cohaesibacter]|uniref:sugar ABC transporter ATP-binding protein n=1 Tax=Cohaesibacter TaxID=655352 RepID=UPI000DE9BE68|nr:MULTISPECIES: sugar ABC transporter ATP-binding protein [Cohaesibacter]TLP46238.1 sugar ABC transporter ATP-binding protein [Cohaesibacter sp. CAU 1516]